MKAHPHPNGDGIEKVYTIRELEEFMTRRSCIYNLPTEKFRRYWIAYAGRPAVYCMIARSDIVVVTQETGEVVFFGLANDEG